MPSTGTKKGYRLAHAEVLNQPPYLNNYAYALANIGCKIEANSLIDQALVLEPGAANLLDTKAQIQQAKQRETAECFAVKLN